MTVVSVVLVLVLKLWKNLPNNTFVLSFRKFIFIVSIILIFSGCSALTKFYVNYAQVFTINPGLPLAVPLNFTTPEFPTNSAYVFEVNNTNKDLIESCKLVNLYTEIVSPDGEDFSFLNSASIYLSAPLLPEVEVASVSNLSDTPGSTIQFQESEAELMEYIKQDKMILRLSTTHDEITTQEIQIRAHMRFFVDAKILGF